MKWYNEDKTKMIDISAVNGFVYIPAKEYIEQNPQESDVKDFEENGDKIEIILGGSVFAFRGSLAEELYKLLISQDKQILKG